MYYSKFNSLPLVSFSFLTIKVDDYFCYSFLGVDVDRVIV